MSDPFLQAQVEALVQRVERLEAQMAQVMGGGESKRSILGREYGDPGSGSVRDEVIALVRDGKKIQAIKVYIEDTGVGLKEAKEAVERWEREYGL